MNGTEAISSLQTCFWMCLILSIVCFVITIVMFFAFNIRMIFNIRTGRAKKRTVEEMQKVSSETGRLRANGKTLTSKLGKKSSAPINQAPAFQDNNYSPQGDAMSNDGSGRTMALDVKPTYTVVSPSAARSINTQYQPQPSYNQPTPASAPAQPSYNQPTPAAAQSNTVEYAETSLLNEEPYEETSLLSNSEETTLLTDNAAAFRIIEMIEYIHTEEIIC